MNEIELIKGDSLQALKGYGDNHFDWAIVDPPYGIGMSDYKRNGNIKFDQSKKWDAEIPSPEYFIQLQRVSKNQIVWGGNYFTEHLPPSKGWIFWNKKQNGNLQIGEMAWTSQDRLKYYERIWQLDRNWQIEKVHPTQKPVQLYQYCLGEFTSEGDLILDTHLGSGSIAIACHQMKRKLIAYEIDAEYYEKACKRFKEQTAQQALW